MYVDLYEGQSVVNEEVSQKHLSRFQVDVFNRNGS